MQQGNDQRQCGGNLDEYLRIRKRGMDLRRHGRKEFCVLEIGQAVALTPPRLFALKQKLEISTFI